MSKLTDSDKAEISALARKALEAGTPDAVLQVVQQAAALFAGMALRDAEFRGELTKIAGGDMDALKEVLR